VLTFLAGENSFEVTRATDRLIEAWLERIVHDNAGMINQPERVDGADLDPRDLPDLLTATTLFAQHRLVIIKSLSENNAAWQALPDLLPRLSDEIDLILIEAKPDKRTTIFKTLKAASDYQEFPEWTERDGMKAEAWLQAEAAAMNLSLDKKSVRQIVERAGVNQWELFHALEKLALLDSVDEQTINDTIDASPSDNVFALFETALKGDRKRVHAMLATFELTEDPFRLLGLLSTQVFQLAAIQAAEPSDSPSKDFGIAPFVVTKFSTQAKRLTTSDARRMIKAFADADADIKSSRGEPWLVIEKALLSLER
jgi:DNA polymerase III subunit delta